MLESFPTELVMAIIVEAAELFVVSDRATVHSLALTARYVFYLIRPILLRRFFISDSNHLQVDRVLADQEAGALVLDLNIASSLWTATPEVFNCLKNLRCIRGLSETIKTAIPLLSESAKSLLREIQLWDDELIPNVPLGITHICLDPLGLGNPPLSYLVPWLRFVPSITHIGVEMVVRGDHRMSISPDDLARGLGCTLTAGGPRLQRVAVRICGEPSDDEPWERLIVVLKSWSRTDDMVAMKADQRVVLWRDRRVFKDWSEDTQAAINDPLAGIDIWTSARPLIEW